MPQDYRSTYHSPRSERREQQQDFGRRGRMRSGEDRDRYQSGDERRYRSEWDQRSFDRGFAGDRFYPQSGYPEEFDYRRDYRADDDRLTRERYGLWSRRGGGGEPLRWDDDLDYQDYYGAGSHYGGGYGTAPSARTSGAGSWGDAGYSRSGAWSERDDWLPESGRSATSGNYESFGRSPYGAQSAYGRPYTPPTNYASHRGRGPKGYERSDERLREMICERLTDDPYVDASDMSVDVVQKVVRLTGSVPERRMKYAAEDLIELCGGIKDIDNQLRVQTGRLSLGGSAKSSEARPGYSQSSKRP
jgi:hypothetical protein